MKSAMPMVLFLASFARASMAVVVSKHLAAQAPSVYPVSKVVELLRNMKAELEKEGDADEEIYSKLACWCETNDKAKTKAIADAQLHLSNLQATIETNTALSETLKAEIEGLEQEIKRNEESLAKATALRAKQKAEFVGEEKETVQSIQALNAAVTVLAKHHTGGSAAASALATIKVQLQRHGALLRGVITPRQRRSLAAFVQAPGTTFKQASYVPQSGEIFGILRQMKATFEADLSQSQRDELAAQEAYAGVKVAKEEEIRTGQASLQDKKEQHAKAVEMVAQAKADQEDTEASLSADQKFLLELTQKCKLTDQEWEERQKLRKAELAAVAEAIGILANDDARDLFHKNFNREQASFVQVQQAGRGQGRKRAASFLLEAAAKTGNPKLAALATSARLDAFVRVKKAIDDMIAQLSQESENEVKHRDQCIAGLNTNELDTAKELHTKKTTEAKVSTLEMKVKQLQATIDTWTAEIQELNVQKQRAGENRQAEKKEFDAVLAEQKEAESLLNQALTVLESKYRADNGGETSLVQSNSTYGTPPPPGFTAYEKSGQAVSVLALIEHIIKNCQGMQQASQDAETAAIEAYQQFVRDTNQSVQTKQDAIVGRTSEKTDANTDLLQAKSELEGTVTALETLSKGLADFKSSCDYTIRNFDVRQEARDQEVDALRQAKAFLSGMQ